MMENIFLKILNMSITAGWLVLAVVLLRLLLKKAPKAVLCLLWGLVGVRLLCPFTVQSVLSLIPSAETLPEEFLYAANPELDSGLESVNSLVNPIISEALAPEPWASANPTQILSAVAARLWLIGVAVMLVYALISYWRLRFRVRVSLREEGNLYLCDAIGTPFILGIFRPRIYLPSALEGEERAYVLAHERAHLRRRDHWWKPLGFFLLAVHWFNPLIWLAYVLLCWDIELACDEKVIRAMEKEEKKAYSEALLRCSMPRRGIAACPLAFGEVGVKRRIRSVLNYKKPAFWLILLAVAACLAMAVFFLTDPMPKKKLPESTSHSELEGLSLVLKELDLDHNPSVTVDWVNRSGKQVDFGKFFGLEYLQDGEWVDCELREGRVFISIGYMLKNNGTFEQTYDLSHFDLSRAGTYRITGNCSVQTGNQRDNYAVSLEFELEQGLQPLYLDPVEMVYENGTYSFTVDVESQPDYRFFNGFLHSRSGADWQDLGMLYSVELNQTNFDSLFYNTMTWYSSGPASLRRNNAQAWKTVNEDNVMILLEQKSGDYYLAMGNESNIRWVFRLQKGTESNAVIGGADGPTSVTVLPMDAAIDRAVLERYGASERDGYIHSAAHAVIQMTTASGTPQAAFTGYMNVATALVMTKYIAYRPEGDELFPVNELDEVGFFRFSVDENGNYTLQEYSHDYKTYMDQLPDGFDEELLDPWYYNRGLEDACYLQAVEKFSGVIK